MITRGHTDENLENLARTFRERVVEPLRGTRLGRQELGAEILEDVPGALFKREWLDDARVREAPRMGYKRTVVGLDPAEPGNSGSEQALAVVGADINNDLYVIASEGHRGSVGSFLDRALDVAREHQATIVVERNHGGQALLELLRSKLAERGIVVGVREVWASQGKRPRAEGTALLAEQGHLHFVGHQPELEEELCQFTGTSGERFDRGDALVWAAAEFGGYRSPAAGAESRVVPWTSGPARPSCAGRQRA